MTTVARDRCWREANIRKLPLNRAKRPPKESTTINNNLSGGALAPVNGNSECLQGQQDVKWRGVDVC
jgi:hypothetical protein